MVFCNLHFMYIMSYICTYIIMCILCGIPYCSVTPHIVVSNCICSFLLHAVIQHFRNLVELSLHAACDFFDARVVASSQYWQVYHFLWPSPCQLPLFHGTTVQSSVSNLKVTLAC